MFSYKAKNYALLTKDGDVVIKGGALKSRGLEKFQRVFLEEMIKLIVKGKPDAITDLRNQFVNHFLKKYAPAAGKNILRVNSYSLDALSGYDWPGNVRQLENTIERAVALETGEELRAELPIERAKTRAAAAGVGGGVSVGGVLP